MPSQGAAKAKAKANLVTDPAAPPTIIEVTDGNPHKEVSYVNVGGTAQFENHDARDYRVRLWTKQHDKHAAVDVLLPGVGSFTLMTDPDAKEKDEVAFDLLPTSVVTPGKGERAQSGGGGKIIIGPSPSPKKAR